VTFLFQYDTAHNPVFVWTNRAINTIHTADTAAITTSTFSSWTTGLSWNYGTL